MTERAKRKIGYLFLGVVIVLLAGTWLFHKLEGWDWIDSLYFSASTITTVGYGDLYPTTHLSKLVAVAFMFFGIAVVVYSFPLLGEYYVQRRLRMQERMEKTHLDELIHNKPRLMNILEEKTDDANPLPGTSKPRHGRPKR